MEANYKAWHMSEGARLETEVRQAEDKAAAEAEARRQK